MEASRKEPVKERQDTSVSKTPAPLLPAAAAMIAGVGLDRFMVFPVETWTAVIVAAAVVFFFCSRRSGIRIAAVLLIWAGAGAMLHHARFWRIPRDHVLRAMPNKQRRPIRRIITLTARILSRPRQVSAPKRPDYFGSPSRETSFFARVDGIVIHKKDHRATGKIKVFISEPMIGLQVGQRVRLTGVVSRPRGPTNPGQWDRRLASRRYGVMVKLHVPGSAGVKRMSDAVNDSGQWRRWVSDHLSEIFRTGRHASDRADYLLDRMVLGKRTGPGDQIEAAFRKIGASHFLAISGLHITILAVFLWGLGRCLGIGPRCLAGLVWAGVLVYFLAIPDRASTFRAVVMCTVVFFGIMLSRRANLLNSLAAAAIVLVVIRPADPFSPGFQLSFGIVLGLVVCCPRLERLLFGRWFLIRRLRVDRRKDWIVWLEGSMFRLVTTLVSTGLTAWLIAAPMVLYYFHHVSLLAPIATIVLAPLVLLVMIASFAKVLVGLIAPNLGAHLTLVSSGSADVLAATAEQLARIPGASWYLPSPPAWWLILVYGFMLVWVFRRRLRLSRAWPAAMVPGIILAYTLCVFPLRCPTGLSLRVSDVGNGLACLIQFPGGGQWVYDAGSLNRLRAGQEVAATNLLAGGPFGPQAMVISHGNIDHYNAIPALTEIWPGTPVIVSPYVLRQSASSSAVERFLDLLVRTGSRLQTVRRGDRLIGPAVGQARVTVLWPPETYPYPLSSNDSSLVLSVRFAGRRILLTGDIEDKGLGWLLSGGDIKADVLILPHHGEFTPASREFVRRVAPRIAIESSSAGLYRIDADWPAVIGPKGRYVATWRNGAITLTIHPDGRMTLKTFRND